MSKTPKFLLLNCPKNGSRSFKPKSLKGSSTKTGFRHSNDRVVDFFIVGSSKNEVENKFEKANKALKILNDDGNDIMKHDLRS